MTGSAGTKRALVVAYYFPPIACSGTIRSLKFVKYLERCGWHCTVVTVDPACEFLEAKDDQLVAEVPASAKIVQTYAWDPARLFVPKAKSRPAAEPRTTGSRPADGPSRPPRRGFKVRFVELLQFFARTRAGWLPFAVFGALRALRRDRVDVIYTTAPPFVASVVGVVLKFFTRKPLVSDFRDPWVDNTYHIGASTATDRGSRLLERSTFRWSDCVINVSADLDARARARAPREPSAKFVVITNGFDPEDFAKVTRPTAGSAFRITYTGCFYPGSREPFAALDALARLKKNAPEEFAAIELHFVGEPVWPQFHAEFLHPLDLGTHAQFHPFLPHQAALKFMAASDVLLMLGSINVADTGSLPAKLFEYLAAGKPILALVHDGESARFVRATGVGMVVAPDDPAAIADAIVRIYRSIRSGRFSHTVNHDMLRRFDRRALAEQLASLFNGLTVSPREPVRGVATAE